VSVPPSSRVTLSSRLTTPPVGLFTVALTVSNSPASTLPLTVPCRVVMFPVFAAISVVFVAISVVF